MPISKSKIFSIIPSNLFTVYRLVKASYFNQVEVLATWAEFFQDGYRYSRFMMKSDSREYFTRDSDKVNYQVMKDSHRVEKGLSFSEPRSKFGLEVKARIVKFLPYVTDSTVVSSANSAREALNAWENESLIMSTVSLEVQKRYSGLSNPEDFFLTRHSTRDFDGAKIEIDVLVRALELASTAPSVCNRQAWRVDFFFGEDVSRLREFQNGNLGFGDIPALAVISADLNAFSGRGERNQAYVDGGIYSMTLVASLHSLGVSTCMLNLSVENKKAKLLRREMNLADNFEVIMMMAIGYERIGARKAKSLRYPLSRYVHGLGM